MELSGPGGYRLKRVALTPERLEMEATYAQAGSMPPMHFHPSQEERFEVLEGEIAAVIDGIERKFSVGDTFSVGAGIRHQMMSTTPARMRWEVSPPLRTWEFFERLYTSPPRDAEAGAEFLAAYQDEIRFD